MQASIPLISRRRAFGASALAFVLIGSRREALAQVRTPTHVACVGDSITYGYLASSSSKSYPSDLQAMFGSGVKVMNFGRNSATLLSTGDLPYINQAEYTAATTLRLRRGRERRRRRHHHARDERLEVLQLDADGRHHAGGAVHDRPRGDGRSLHGPGDAPGGVPRGAAGDLHQQLRHQRNGHQQRDRSDHPAGRDRRKGCRSSTFTRRPRRAPSSSATASTRPTPATCSSRR